jgi:peptidoglycan LD-endopeptidase CwlK
MPVFGTRSKANLSTCHVELQRLFHEVIKHADCTVIQGHRTQAEQDECFQKGTTQVIWPNSKHNSVPSLAADVCPYPIDWTDRERFAHFAGIVLGVASQLGIAVRWGGDWNRDGVTRNERFFDGPHFELTKGD